MGGTIAVCEWNFCSRLLRLSVLSFHFPVSRDENTRNPIPSAENLSTAWRSVRKFPVDLDI